jgi:hypothetical protein
VYSAQANVTLVALLETVSTALQLGISRALESLRASLDADPDADLDVIFVKLFVVPCHRAALNFDLLLKSLFFSLATKYHSHWELDDFRFDVWPFNMTRNPCLYLCFETYVLDETYQID